MYNSLFTDGIGKHNISKFTSDSGCFFPGIARPQASSTGAGKPMKLSTKPKPEIERPNALLQLHFQIYIDFWDQNIDG